MSDHEYSEIVFSVSGTPVKLPDSAIQRYPYSRLADLAAASFPDDPVALPLTVSIFKVLKTFLTAPEDSSFEIPSDVSPAEMSSAFQELGIPLPGCWKQSHLFAVTGNETQDFEAMQAATMAEDYTPAMREELRKMQKGRLYFRPTETGTALAATNASGEDLGLPTYGDATGDYGTSVEPAKREAVLMADEEWPADFLRRNVFEDFPSALSEAVEHFEPWKGAWVLSAKSTEPAVELAPWEETPVEVVQAFFDSTVYQVVLSDEDCLLLTGREESTRRLLRLLDERFTSALDEWEPKEPHLRTAQKGIRYATRLGKFVGSVQHEIQDIAIRTVSSVGLFETITRRAVVVQVENKGI